MRHLHRVEHVAGGNRVVARAFGLAAPEAIIGLDDHHLPGLTSEQAATGAFAGKGLAGFLQKPYRYEELLAVVRSALES